MIKSTLWLRKTFEYAAGWRSLDTEVPLGDIVLTPRRQTSSGDGDDDGPTYVQHATVPKGISSRDIRAAISNTLGGTNCRCSHDCCGCVIRYVSSRRIGSRRYLVRTAISYNY